MKKKGNLSIDDYVKALERMKKSPQDRIGILGKLGATGLGGLAGAGLAGTTASAAGVATLLGSSTLASILGGVFVTTTPIGWVAGSVIAGGTIGYGISKLVSSGGKSDAKKELNISEIEKKIHSMKKQADSSANNNDKRMVELIDRIEILLRQNKISQADSTDLLFNIEKGNIPIDTAFNIIDDLLKVDLK